MTRVEFHTGVAQPLHFACRLLRKAWRQGVRVLVTAPAPVLRELDRELWTFEALEFVPHLQLGTAQATAEALARTPIWLGHGEPPADAPPVLINLGAERPGEPSRFERIIEVVGGDDDARQGGRRRWREYEALGFAPTHHARAG